jgi:hypothetical protein
MQVTFTAHAVDRYIERVKPCLGPARARVECMGLALIGEVVPVSPDWIGCDDKANDGYLVCGDVCFPLRGGLAVTCLTRGLVSDRVRAAKNHRRALRTWGRTHKRPEGGRPRIEEAA